MYVDVVVVTEQNLIPAPLLAFVVSVTDFALRVGGPPLTLLVSSGGDAHRRMQLARIPNNPIGRSR